MEDAALVETAPPGDPGAEIEACVVDYSRRRHHESIDNRRPADVCFGRGQSMRPDNPAAERKDQTPAHHTPPPAALTASRAMSLNGKQTS